MFSREEKKRSRLTFFESSELRTGEAERNRFPIADRLVDFADQQDAMMVSVVSLYDLYLGGPFVRLTFLS